MSAPPLPSFPVSICPATPADFSGWMELIAAVQKHFPGMTAAGHRKVMEWSISRNTAICACVQETLAGGVAFSPSHGGIGFLAVRPEYRRRGVGTLLMRHALSRMPGESTVFLHVHPGETSALSLYRALGFREGESIRYGGQNYQTFYLAPEQVEKIAIREGEFIRQEERGYQAR